MEAWRGMGDPLGWRPPLCEGWGGLALRHRTGAMRDVNVREFPKGEVRRIPLPATPLNKGMKKGRSLVGPRPEVDRCALAIS
jgi:hypothetical protein